MSVHIFAKQISTAAATFAFTLVTLLSLSTPARSEVQEAVEYIALGPGPWDYDAALFVTSFPDEIAALDGGAFGGAWQRTGEVFKVWSGPENGALPTCRFVSTWWGASHVYTPYAAECAAVKANPYWQYEGIALYLQVPDENGNCPIGTTVLYRISYELDDVHRLTTRPPPLDQLLAAGGVFEGDGRTFAFACVPS